MSEAVRTALQQAIKECREHNGDYHWATSDEKLARWESALSAAPKHCECCSQAANLIEKYYGRHVSIGKVLEDLERRESSHAPEGGDEPHVPHDCCVPGRCAGYCGCSCHLRPASDFAKAKLPAPEGPRVEHVVMEQPKQLDIPPTYTIGMAPYSGTPALQVEAAPEGMGRDAITKFYPAPWTFKEDAYNGGPGIVDAKGNCFVTLFWALHLPEETEQADSATFSLGRKIAELAHPTSENGTKR